MRHPRLNAGLSVLLFFVYSKSFGYDFNCEGAKRIVETLALGPDRATNKMYDNPEWFVDSQIPNWKCLTKPYPPEKNNSVYMEGIQCFRSNNKTSPNEKDFVDAGLVYKNNIKRLLQCFPNNINSTPISYSSPSRGEGFRVAINEYVKDKKGKRHHILMEYGYAQSDPSSYILWEITAGVGSPK